MGQQSPLLALGVDLKARILGVEIDQGHALDAGGSLDQGTVDLRAVEARVSEQDEDAPGSPHGCVRVWIG
jgi:hypothetical protein